MQPLATAVSCHTPLCQDPGLEWGAQRISRDSKQHDPQREAGQERPGPGPGPCLRVSRVPQVGNPPRQTDTSGHPIGKGAGKRQPDGDQGSAVSAVRKELRGRGPARGPLPRGSDNPRGLSRSWMRECSHTTTHHLWFSPPSHTQKLTWCL